MGYMWWMENFTPSSTNKLFGRKPSNSYMCIVDVEFVHTWHLISPSHGGEKKKIIGDKFTKLASQNTFCWSGAVVQFSSLSIQFSAGFILAVFFVYSRMALRNQVPSFQLIDNVETNTFHSSMWALLQKLSLTAWPKKMLVHSLLWPGEEVSENIEITIKPKCVFFHSCQNLQNYAFSWQALRCTGFSFLACFFVFFWPGKTPSKKKNVLGKKENP